MWLFVRYMCAYIQTVLVLSTGPFAHITPNMLRWSWQSERTCPVQGQNSWYFTAFRLNLTNKTKTLWHSYVIINFKWHKLPATVRCLPTKVLALSLWEQFRLMRMRSRCISLTYCPGAARKRNLTWFLGWHPPPPDPPIKSAWRHPNMDMYSGC